MGLTRKGLLRPLSAAVAMAATTVLVVGAAAAPVDVEPVDGAPAPGAAAAPVPRADLSHHGYVSLWGDRIAIRIRSENRGPSDVTASTVRLRFSAPLAPSQELPYGCLRGGKATVLCETGGLRSAGGARQTALDLRLAGRPDEVVVRLDGVWSGGARDTDRTNDVHEVLAPATGDAYAF
ncbi:hypothetical protein [Streptomyces cyaneofuscatus]|uniref:hypothetical protein n=1 Tax=Streptomyces cyaneofuscatus TaxID=66883 RepID=UPI00369E64C3